MHSKKYLPPILALSLVASLPTAFAQLNQTVFFDDGRDIVGYNGENFVGDINSTNPPANGFNLEKLSFRYNPVEDYLDIRITTDGVAGDVDGDDDPDTGPNDSEFWIGESLAFAIDMDCDGTDDFSFGMTPFNSFKEREAGEIILVRGIDTEFSRLNVTFKGFFNLNGEDIDAGIFLQLPSKEHPDAIFRLPDWSLFGENPEQFRATAYLKADQDSRDFDVMQVSVNTNFSGPGNIRVEDDILDVGIAPGATNPTTGWNLTTTNFEYDPFADTLRVIQRFTGIAGDADGDGNPDSSTHPFLPSNADRPNLSGSETIAIAFDFDDDDTFDTVIGVPADGEIDPADLTIPIADFNGTITNLGLSFGAADTSGATARLEHNPSAANPDFIVIIDNFSKLHFTPFQFSYRAFAGSQADGGYGEDNQVSDVALNVIGRPRSENFFDPLDVGVPFQARGTISGWDIKTLNFRHDPSQDKLTIDLGFHGRSKGESGIAGDVDGDGDPGVFSTENVDGIDEPNLGGSETISVGFDIDQDGIEDIVVGVPGGTGPGGEDISRSLDVDTLRLPISAVAPNLPLGRNYGAPNTSGATAFVEANPSSDHPNFTIKIFGWSLLDPSEPSKFDYRVIAGSLADGGYGEDFAPAQNLPPQVTRLRRGFETPSADVNPSGESFVDVIGDEDTQYKLTYRTTIPDVGAATQAAIRIEEMLDGNISNDGTFKTDSIGKAKICFELPPAKRGFVRVEEVPVQSN